MKKEIFGAEVDIKFYFEGFKEDKYTMSPVKFSGKLFEVRQSAVYTYLVGLGKIEELHEKPWRLEKAVIAAAKKIKSDMHVRSIRFEIDSILDSALDYEQMAKLITHGVHNGYYTFQKYIVSKNEDDALQHVPDIIFNHIDPCKNTYMKELITQEQPIVDAAQWAKDMINSAPNDVYPASFCGYANKLFKDKAFISENDFYTLYSKITLTKFTKDLIQSYGCNTRIYSFSEKTISAHFPSLWAVGKGASQKPRFLVVEYKHPETKFTKPLVLVGKGICFDTGGDDTKPAESKHLMRMDMSGAAHVTATVKALMDMDMPVWVVAISVLAMNKGGEDCYTQEDVVGTYKNGPTTYVKNTDAEGRVVLSDGLRFGALEYDPEIIMSDATLTGAALVAFGDYGRTAVMSNNKNVENIFIQAADDAGLRVSPLPVVDEELSEKMDGSKEGANHQSTPENRWAGTITAFQFLKEKVCYEKEIPFLHWDIASEMEKPENRGSGVRALVLFVAKILANKRER